MTRRIRDAHYEELASKTSEERIVYRLDYTWR